MGELIIKTHDFEASKNQIKAFSEQTQTDLELHKVDISGGFFGLGDHKVTGYELNSLTTQIQDYLIDINSLSTKLIKEFGQVYNALDALDKDYIQAILIAFKAAEKANDEAKVAQGDITKTIELQKKTISVLKQFKEKIESYEHLGDVDKLWDVSIKMREEISLINNDIKNINLSAKNQLQAIEMLNQFKTTLEEYEHLEEIDEIWDKCKAFERAIITSNDIINAHEVQIDDLKNCIQEIQKQNDEKIQTFSQKIKIAYALAGVSIGIVIIEFFLQMLRMI